ncbi:response regulator [Chitinimonas naiadis]
MTAIPPCVLIVDDDDTNRRVARLLLQRAGYWVSEAASGREALELLANQPFAMVLLDLSMPGMGGLDVCQRIHELFSDPRPILVAYTAHVLDEDKAVLLSTGFDDLLTKPISKEALLACALKWTEGPAHV